MKRLCLALVVLLVGCPKTQTYQASLSWKNVNAICTATVTTSCSKLATVTDSTTGAVLTTVPASTTAVTVTPPQVLESQTFKVVFSGFDEKGNTIVSPPATLTLNVP